MARGRYSESPEQQAFRELIEYAEDTGPRFARHKGGYPLHWLYAGDGMVTEATLGALLKLRAPELEALRLEVRALLRFLAGAESEERVAARVQVEVWAAKTDPVPASPVGRRLRARRVGRRGASASKAVTHFIHGAPRDAVLYQVILLLGRIGGAERLRLCPAPDCGRVFLKVGRRDFCSDRCRQRVYASTYNPFAARPRRPDRPRPSRGGRKAS